MDNEFSLVDMNKQSHGELFNAVSHVLHDKTPMGTVRGHSPLFSRRLACTEEVMETINAWWEKWEKREDQSYSELMNSRRIHGQG